MNKGTDALLREKDNEIADLKQQLIQANAQLAALSKILRQETGISQKEIEARIMPRQKSAQSSAQVIPVADQLLKSRDFEGKVLALNNCVSPSFSVNTKNFYHNKHYLTDEMQHGLDLVATGSDLKVEAGAGAGKTSLLTSIAHHTKPDYGLYITFSKDIAKHSAKLFPNGTQVKTAHSLAYRDVGHRFQNRLEVPLNSSMVVQALQLKQYKELSPWLVANVLMAWVARFCSSGLDEINERSAPWEFLKVLTKEGTDDKALKQAKAIAQELKPQAVRLWSLLTDPDSRLPITHDVYLKLWALGNPRLNQDLILFDEAQDANPVMLKVVTSQDCQKVWVGDRRQQIYAWRGAVNAMDKIKTTNTCSLTRSFRYGQPIAEMANAVMRNYLGETSFNLVGAPNKQSQLTKVRTPDAYLCRSNRSAIGQMMSAIADRKKVYIPGGVKDLIRDVESARSLMYGKRPASPALQVFESWQELVEFSETEVGSEWTSLVKLLDTWNADKLLHALHDASKTKEDHADVLIATVHGIKGREFKNVKLANDFSFPSTETMKCKSKFTKEEANILYVAITRAINTLDISECSAAQVALEGPSKLVLDMHKNKSQGLNP